MYIFSKHKILFTSIVLIFLLGGCTQLPLRSSVESVFSPYVDDFFRRSPKPRASLIVRFSQTEGGGFHGACSMTKRGQQIIEVSQIAWQGLCPMQRRALVFHELGHCILNREHVTEATSYMYFGMLPCDHYDKNSEKLDSELFVNL